MEDEKQEQHKGINESQILTALLSRLHYFKENAESLTLEKVRRLIENDLGIEKYSLDVHKRFIKQFLEERLESGNEDSGPKDSGECLEKDTSLSKGEGETSPEEHKTKKTLKGSGAEDENKMDECPILGATDSKSTLADVQDAKASESSIKRAILERAAYFRANTEAMTLISVRRYLEEEIGLEKNSLDPFKKFIKVELDKVLNSSDVPTSKSSIEKTSEDQNKPIENIITEGVFDSSNSESDREKRTKSTKKAVPRAKNDKSERSKKRKSSDSKYDVTKKQKVVKKSSGNNNDSEESDRGESEDYQSCSTAAMSAKKKAVSASGYGEAVEKLKSIIKACGMSIPPFIYKKAKQVSEDKRQDFLIKELEEILSKEGLSSHPSEKEIKEVRKRKNRARELEGIDMSNIVSSSRRRSTATSFVPPPKPESPVKDDESDASSDRDDDSSDTDEDADDDVSQVDDLSEDHDDE